ncbi:MAG: cupin domain-containing protein [Anaerolineales bacterium]|jgi:mannose-6-phosphate isomerase-like protein (cupin superfamily)
MNDFPEFMKNPINRVHATSEYIAGLEGYVYDGADGSQIAFWTCRDGGVAAEHMHPFDEYMVVVQGQYTLCMGSKRFPLRPGDEFLVPKGVPHFGDRIPGTRTIHAFGGKRAQRDSEVKS